MLSSVLRAAPVRSTTEPPDVLESTDVEETLAPLWRVICHDDPITTMDFVVEILRGIFRLTTARATELMYQVHYTGSALVGHWPEDVARRKVRRATSRARTAGFPLTFTVEKDD